MTLDSSFTLCFENAKCFLCDGGFSEGDDTFLVFENRLRDDGEIDSPLAAVLSTALGQELQEHHSHSSLLCSTCNRVIVEFERLLQRFFDMRYKIITSYNRTAAHYNLPSIELEIDLALPDEENTLCDEAIIEENIGTADNITEQETKVIAADPKQVIANDAQDLMDNYAMDLVEEVQDEEATTLSEDNISKDYGVEVVDLNNEALIEEDIIVYGDKEPEVSYKDVVDHISGQIAQDLDSNSSQNTTDTFYQIEETQSDSTISLEKSSTGQLLFEREGDFYKCIMCNEKTLMNAINFATHMSNEHETTFYSCDVCQAGFISEENLQAHMMHEHHTSSEPSAEYPSIKVECDICGRSFTTNRLLRLHKRTHTTIFKHYECSQCHKLYNSKNLFLDHMNMHTGDRPYKCNVCSKDFASKSTLQVHLKIHSNRPRPFKCDECGKAFFSHQQHILHKKLHSGIKSFICPVCSKAFGTQHNLDVHKIIHTGERPFICRTCGKAFARRAEIRDHERTHTGEKPYKCDMCDAAFAQRSNLMTHRKNTHLNEKQHTCGQCGRSFKRRRLLEYHINAVHTGVRPYSCDICVASFVYPEHKKKHMLIHANSKPYTCEVCGREFNSRDNRNAHRFVHSLKKPYECLECGAGFMRKPLLLAHMKQTGHHSDTIIINQPQINTDVAPTFKDASSSNKTNIAENEFIVPDDQSLDSMMTQVENLNDEQDVKILEIADIEKSGQQILTWIDIGPDKISNGFNISEHTTSL